MLNKQKQEKIKRFAKYFDSFLYCEIVVVCYSTLTHHILWNMHRHFIVSTCCTVLMIFFSSVLKKIPQITEEINHTSKRKLKELWDNNWCKLVHLHLINFTWSKNLKINGTTTWCETEACRKHMHLVNIPFCVHVCQQIWFHMVYVCICPTSNVTHALSITSVSTFYFSCVGCIY